MNGDLGIVVDFDSRFAGHPQFRGWTLSDFVEYHLYQYNERAAIKVVLGSTKNPLPARLALRVEPAYLEIAPLPVARWITDCPSPNCSGAEYVRFEEPIFMCTSCWNVQHSHRYLTVGIPAPDERLAIERVLLSRPIANRRMNKGESLAELRMENIQHGYEV